MKLNLNKPIVFFDLETTGVNIVNDRIVEISILKIYPNTNKAKKILGWYPKIKFETGLRKTIKSFKNEQNR